MPFSDGFSAFVEGYTRAADSAANRKRLEEADKRTEQMFSMQMDEANARKREREQQEAARKMEADTYASLNKPVTQTVPDSPVDAVKSTVDPSAVLDSKDARAAAPEVVGAIPGSANDGNAGESAASTRKLTAVDYSQIDKSMKSGSLTPSQIFQGGLSGYARDMKAAETLRASGNPYAMERADAIMAKARRARAEGMEDAMSMLDSGDTEGALKAFQSSGAMRLPEGVKLVDSGTTKDFTGAERKKYSLVGADGKVITDDAHAAVYSYVFTPKERKAYEMARVNNDAKLEMAKEKLEQAKWLAQFKATHRAGAGAGAAAGEATVKDLSTASEQIFKHMQGVYGADKDATPQERAAANSMAVGKAAEASSIWKINAQAGNVIPPVVAANALTIAQDKSKVMVQKTSKGDSVYVVNVGGMPVILGQAKPVASTSAGASQAEPGAAAPAAPAKASQAAQEQAGPTYQKWIAAKTELDNVRSNAQKMSPAARESYLASRVPDLEAAMKANENYRTY